MRHLCLPLLAIIFAPSGFAGAEPKIDFAKSVQPILKRHCYACHGAQKQESNLRLDRRSSALRGGDLGEPTIVPGKPGDSALLRAVSGKDDDLIMPPKGERLSANEIRVLQRWIAEGASYPEAQLGEAKLTTDHWSFQPIAPLQPPLGGDPWVGNPIDGFVLARLRTNGLRPAPPADRRMFIRRLYLTLHGMPPAPDEVRRYVDDRRPGARARLVDRALASPRYGERWGRHWLDVVRFAESDGFETNRERLRAYPFRDYVIEAFNDDKPFDRFVTEQLAGDVVGEQRGTGFLVAGAHDIVRSQDINLTLMQRQDELADYVNTTGTAFLGITIGCARCHNHKFDPVLQKDYYSLQAVFAGVRHGERALESQRQRQQAEAIKRVETKIQDLRSRLAQLGGARPTAQMNVENIRPTVAKRIRFTIFATNSSEPCIDELEVYCTKKHGEVRNVALSLAGGVATSSGNLPGYEIHKLKHVNDGKLGNSHSWISNTPGRGWVQIDFDRPYEIDKIIWGRDRLKRFVDRVATDYMVEVAVADEWVSVAGTRGGQGKSEAERRQIGDLRAELQRAEQELSGRQATSVASAYIGRFEKPEIIHRLYRGEPTAKREVVAPDTLSVIGTLKLTNETPERTRRLRLAQWIVSPENPLTPRVFVNRLWHYHFGTGLVASPSDFGANGQPPSHPQLLDWLAAELVRSRWSVKHIQRLILMSNTFAQTSAPTGDGLSAGLAKDADCRLLWRFPPRRMEAEAIRDCVLSVTGAIDLRMKGRGFLMFDVQRENVYHYFAKQRFGPAEFRRMVYMTKIRQEQDAIFGAFDCPDGSQTIPRRSQSTTPIQALNLLNSDFMLQQAKIFAERLEKECGQSVSRQVDRAFEICFGRSADAEERREATLFAERFGMESLCRTLLNANEFLFIP